MNLIQGMLGGWLIDDSKLLYGRLVDDDGKLLDQRNCADMEDW